MLINILANVFFLFLLAVIHFFYTLGSTLYTDNMKITEKYGMIQLKNYNEVCNFTMQFHYLYLESASGRLREPRKLYSDVATHHNWQNDTINQVGRGVASAALEKCMDYLP